MKKLLLFTLISAFTLCLTQESHAATLRVEWSFPSFGNENTVAIHIDNATYTGGYWLGGGWLNAGAYGPGTGSYSSTVYLPSSNCIGNVRVMVRDSYGDGWNGNAWVKVFIDNVQIAPTNYGPPAGNNCGNPWGGTCNTGNYNYYNDFGGNPSIANTFGVNEWKVFGYAGRDRYLNNVSYKGVYTETALSYNTTNRWSSGGSPDDASGYQGCAMSNDNHTVVSKRRGFPAGYYAIDVNGHDDEIVMYVNGTQVYERSGTGAYLCGIWNGYLNANSTVEFRHADGGGGSFHGLNFKSILNYGDDSWNIYAFDGQNRDNLSATSYKGYYTRNSLGINTLNDYGNLNSPTNASGWFGCGDPGIDNHTVVAMREGFPCGMYSLEVAYHDDEASLIVDGTLVWSAGCCNNTGVKWTGILDANSTVEMRYSDGAGGHGMVLNVNDAASQLYAGTIAYSGLTAVCIGYNPPIISSSTATGGTSAAVSGGASSYQWQLNGGDINGATSTSYDPGSLTSTGIKAYRRKVTDKCGNTAYSESITIVVGSPPTITSTAEDLCEGSPKQLQASYGGGTFSSSCGSCISGSIFTAPSPSSGNSETYIISYSASGGSCTATQSIKVYKTPISASAGADVQSCMTGTATMAASQPSVGTGIWTWQTQPTYTSGNPITPTATVSFNAGGTHTGTWTISNGACGDAANPQTANVVVTSGANNMTLVNSTSVTAVEVCTEGLWTYYATAAKPDEYLFAIDKNGNSFSADVTITDVAGSAPIESLGGNVRGTWLLSRYWNASITSGSITSTVAIRYFIDDAELTAAQNAANAFLASSPLSSAALIPLTFFKTQSAAFDPNTDIANGDFTFTPTYLNIKTSGTTNGLTYYELDGITSFSGGTGGFGVNDGGSSLPVELISFNAKAVDNQYIQLDWATATEINNDGFEVLRSTNGIDFERIAWMDGHGNSTETNEYVFRDHGVNKGVNYYYQLKQIDFDGQYEYFDIKTARLEGQTNFFIGALVPNPSKGNDVVSVNVETTTGEVMTVQIFDQIGAEVKKVTYMLFAAENGLDIDVSDLVEGTYFLTFETRMGKETRKLVVIK